MFPAQSSNVTLSKLLFNIVFCRLSQNDAMIMLFYTQLTIAVH